MLGYGLVAGLVFLGVFGLAALVVDWWLKVRVRLHEHRRQKALDAVRDYLACSYDDAVALLTGTLDATAVVALHERTAAPDADDRTKGDAA